jgi:outer membrane protein assembly factor BamD
VIKYFEALDTLYPFGTYSEQADLQLIYAYYQHDDIPLAEAAADRFIRLYPRSCYVDYAYYMKGLADFEQDRGWVQKYFPTDLTQRDPGAARQAFNDFGILVRLFPTSYYAPDARQHMVYIRNLSAAYEFHVACFYYKRGAFVAAANRCSYIMQHYDGTPAEYSALTMLMHCYQILGLPDLAAQVNQVWQYNQG